MSLKFLPAPWPARKAVAGEIRIAMGMRGKRWDFD
jgi:hypothetical protein